MPKWKYYDHQTGYGNSPDCEWEDEECPNHPDLYLLRDAAADERGAIADYLECAFSTCSREVFLHVTEEEMEHYVLTMRLISLLDPVQADFLEEEGLDFLVTKRHMGKSKWKQMDSMAGEEEGIKPPDKKDSDRIRCLTEAIKGELQAINKYQRYMNQAKHELVKKHFCDLMNDEKEHVAEFTAALFRLTHEPLEESY